jgi:hypothetical protein
MTNINKTPEKLVTRKRLGDIGVEALQMDGWAVEKIRGSGKSSMRRITRGKERRDIAIRTTQDQWIAFPRNDSEDGWKTLSQVDAVVVVSVDDVENPRFGLVHFIEGDEMRSRFDRAYEARIAAGHQLDAGRGIWLSLYHREANPPVRLVGAGVGRDHPPIVRLPLWPEKKESNLDVRGPMESITILEAKELLARSLGVDPSNIRISIEA